MCRRSPASVDGDSFDGLRCDGMRLGNPPRRVQPLLSWLGQCINAGVVSGSGNREEEEDDVKN